MKHSILAAALSLLVAIAQAATADSLVRVRLATTMGDITVELYNTTPQHRDNFVRLVKAGYYDGLLFHRVIRDFMIQGGDPDSRDAEPKKVLGEGGPGYTIPAEIDYPRHYHKRGSLAAAREGDDVNPEMRSSGSQFYIVWGKVQTAQDIERANEQLREATDGEFEMPVEMAETYETIGGTPHLDGAYTVFGEVTEGLDVVRKIQGVLTDRHDRPKKDVKIIKAEIVGAEE